VAFHLAEAAARTGARTLLIEVNFQDPSLAARLGIAHTPGFVDVLRTSSHQEDLTPQSLKLTKLSSETAGHTMDVLPAGSCDAGPGGSIQSDQMGIVIAREASVYDLVVVDAPPLLTAPDAFPALRSVDGVVVVGRIGRDQRDVAHALRQLLHRSKVPLLGVVANRTKARHRTRTSEAPIHEGAVHAAIGTEDVVASEVS
jgi:Mrp family chromosome partitioning ATPase